MKIDRNTWNDWHGLENKIEQLPRSLESLKGILNFEVVRLLVDPNVVLVALDQVDREVKAIAEWSSSLRSCLEDLQQGKDPLS